MRLALIIEYEGTEYSGFQFQENARTIQGELEKSINCLTGDFVRIKGAGSGYTASTTTSNITIRGDGSGGVCTVTVSVSYNEV